MSSGAVDCSLGCLADPVCAVDDTCCVSWTFWSITCVEGISADAGVVDFGFGLMLAIPLSTYGEY